MYNIDISTCIYYSMGHDVHKWYVIICLISVLNYPIPGYIYNSSSLLQSFQQKNQKILTQYFQSTWFYNTYKVVKQLNDVVIVLISYVTTSWNFLLKT